MNSLSFFMSKALKEAQAAFERGSVPVGAIVVRDDKIIASAGNEVIKSTDSTAHAEVLAIRRAEQYLQSLFLTDCDLFVTLEPCAMCAEAISLARIRTLYFGAYDAKCGAVVHGSRVFRFAIHKPRVISGILETKCSQILTEFFKRLR